MKVLVISHNPVSTYNAMGKTLLSLLSGFEKEELCQLYIYPGRPNVDACGSYFRVTDKDMLKRFLRKDKGGVVSAGEGNAAFDDGGDEKLYRGKQNKAPLVRLLRDLLWKLSGWESERLLAWVREQAPDCIFAAPGAAMFLYDMAMRLSSLFSLPIVTYVCDEYYFVKPSGLFDRYRLKKLRRKMDALAEKTARFVTISDELTAVYSEHFRKQAITIMTGADLASPIAKNKDSDCISFFGNVRANRYRSLMEIGRAIDKLNRAHGFDYKLHVYTAEKDEEIRKQLCSVPAVRLCPFLSGEAFYGAMGGSAFLLHVESFEEQTVDRVKHSISTKIADSLASGVPLIAYGPGGISSMDYLERNRCAFVSHDPDGLEGTLLRAFTDATAREVCVENALRAAEKHHDRRANSLRLRSVLTEAAGTSHNGKEKQKIEKTKEIM